MDGSPTGGARLLFRCQACQAVLDVNGGVEDVDVSRGAHHHHHHHHHQQQQPHGGGGGVGARPLDESFVVLPSDGGGGVRGGGGGARVSASATSPAGGVNGGGNGEVGGGGEVGSGGAATSAADSAGSLSGSGVVVDQHQGQHQGRGGGGGGGGGGEVHNGERATGVVGGAGSRVDNSGQSHPSSSPSPPSPAMDEKNTAGAHRPGAQTTAATGGGRNGGAGGGNPNPNPNANTIAAIAAAVNNMEESFVVLPSSVSRTPRDVAGVGLDARFAALARIFDMASDETGVDHPMCLECAAQLREELDARVKETQAECETYRECLRDLGEELSDEDEDEEEDEEEEAGAGDAEDAGSSPGRGKGKGGRRKRAGGGKGKGRGGGGGGGGSGSRTATSTTRTRTKKEEEEEEEEAALAADLARCEAEEAAELARAATLEAELDKLRAERRRLEDRGRELDAREDGYWNDFNDFKLSLRSHVEERDRLVVNIEQTSRQLERLRRTNVFNDAFHIWFDGPFGTVNGFRLGRLPSVAVEWDEINAAWGMACLLLSTMAQSVKLRFRAYTLQPLGSFSKVVDARGNSYELYGPVNILSSHKYDRAMAGFLACLQEFAQFAAERDKQNGVEPAFELPYQIDGDKIDGRKIAFPFNRYERWTAALKIMLTDLKTCLAWLSNNQQ